MSKLLQSIPNPEEPAPHVGQGAEPVQRHAPKPSRDDWKTQRALSRFSSYHCIYVDHKSAPVDQLGALLQQVPTVIAPSLGNDVAFLATCQRLEFYTSDNDVAFPIAAFSSLLSNVRITSGFENILNRLSRISAGTESLLLGEQLIQQQVERAFGQLPPHSRIRAAATKASRIAARARKKFSFVAESDYCEVSLSLLRDKKLCELPSAETLIVVGSGMLGRSILRHPAARAYPEVVGVSRWGKQLRKKLATPGIKCMRPERSIAHVANTRFDVIFAVDNATPEYLATLQTLLNCPGRRAAVDLSTRPLSSSAETPHYIHEYDAKFTETLEAVSLHLVDKVSDVRGYIAALTAQLAEPGRADLPDDTPIVVA